MSLDKGITIDGLHSYDDLGLILATYYLPEPKVKDERISIPFASGSVDLTESAGYVPYKDRDGVSFEFVLKNKSYDEFYRAYHSLVNKLHGRKVKVILDEDPNYYYMMRLDIDAKKTDVNFSRITIKGDAEPFKYNLIASNEPWLWNPFSFVNGKIVESTADIVVDGTKDVLVEAGGILTSPTFYVYTSPAPLKVYFNDVAYDITRDSSSKAYNVFRFPQIKVGDEDVTLTFKGKGKVSVEYRGRYL